MSDELSTTFDSRNQIVSGFKTEQNLASLAILAGAVCLFVGISVASSNPATGYEVSIYDSTPTLFWAGIGLSMLTGLVALALATSWIQWVGGLFLSVLSMLSVVALPLVRGYFFYGLSDGVRHLGAARRLFSGESGFFEHLYPAGYAFSSFLTALSGAPIERSMIFVMFAMMALYVVFVVLCVRVVLPYGRAVTVATLVAILFLPLNHVSLHPHFHTFSMATFFTPVLLYVVFKHLTARTADETLPGRFSSTDLGFAVLGTAALFYHPQATTNILLIMGTIAATQFVGSRYSANALSRSPRVYGQLLFLLVIFTAWNLQDQAIFAMSSNMTKALTGLFLGTAQGGQIVAERVNSAQSVGLGVVELFTKLFSVQAVFGLAAAGTVVAMLRGDYFDEKSETVITALAVAGVVFSVYALAHFVGEMSGYFFRHFGFGMMLVTILAAIGLARAGDYVDDLSPSLARSVRIVAGVGIVICLLLSALVIFPSPYLSLPTEHVSEQQYTGHVDAMEYRVGGAAVASTDANPRRYATARGSYLDPRLAWGVPPEALPSDLRRYRGDDYPDQEFYYYIQSELDKERELVAYRGIRFTEQDFTGVETTSGVSRVVTNGRVDVYYVEYGDGPVIDTRRIETPETTVGDTFDARTGVTAQ